MKKKKKKEKDCNRNAWVRRSEEVGESKLQLLLLASAMHFILFFFLMLLQIMFIQLLQFSEWIIYETNPDI